MDSSFLLRSMEIFAVLVGALGGACLGFEGFRAARSAWFVRQKRAALRGLREAESCQSLESRVVAYMVELSQRLATGSASSVTSRVSIPSLDSWICVHAKRAGKARALSTAGFLETSLRCALVCALMGILGGVAFSTELALLGGFFGACAGVSVPLRSLKYREQKRVEALEQNLSEMLEVVSLGLRSGLSFDRSFELYCSHFDVFLAQECAAAQRAWTAGLVTREAALRDIADSYDSLLLGRVVETIIRSLQFGSSLIESLESAALEARADRRASIEERVAKAPIKMMIPTGTLILPAMLLLVLGPVLLELMEGF